jgi:hypothetical protein
MPPETATIPREEFEPQLHVTTLTRQDIRALLRSNGWNRLEPRNAQLAFLLEFAATDCIYRAIRH